MWKQTQWDKNESLIVCVREKTNFFFFSLLFFFFLLKGELHSQEKNGILLHQQLFFFFTFSFFTFSFFTFFFSKEEKIRKRKKEMKRERGKQRIQMKAKFVESLRRESGLECNFFQQLSFSFLLSPSLFFLSFLSYICLLERKKKQRMEWRHQTRESVTRIVDWVRIKIIYDT